MPRIPKYEQGKLASSVVGTPGIDTSAAEALGAKASALGSIATGLTSLAGAIAQDNAAEQRRLQVEARARQQEQKQIERAMKTAQDELELAKVRNEARERWYTVESDALKDPNNIHNAVPSYSKAIEQDINSVVGAYSADPLLQTKIRTSLTSDYTSRREEFYNAAKRIQTEKAIADFKTTLDKATLSAGGFSTFDSLENELNRIVETNRTAGVLAYGAKYPEEERKFAEEYVTNWLYSQARANPQQIGAVLDDERVNKYLPEKDQFNIKGRVLDIANAEFTRQEQERRFNGAVAFSNAMNTLQDEIATGKPLSVDPNQIRSQAIAAGVPVSTADSAVDLVRATNAKNRLDLYNQNREGVIQENTKLKAQQAKLKTEFSTAEKNLRERAIASAKLGTVNGAKAAGLIGKDGSLNMTPGQALEAYHNIAAYQAVNTNAAGDPALNVAKTRLLTVANRGMAARKGDTKMVTYYNTVTQESLRVVNEVYKAAGTSGPRAKAAAIAAELAVQNAVYKMYTKTKTIPTEIQLRSIRAAAVKDALNDTAPLLRKPKSVPTRYPLPGEL